MIAWSQSLIGRAKIRVAGHYRSIALIACAFALSAADTIPTITLTARVEATLDRRLFGGFLERPSFSAERGPEAACDAAGGLPPAVVDRLRELGPQVVRFPGGTGVDYDDWTDLIDRAPGRADPARPLTQGHQGGTYTNRFGMDAFLALRDQLGFAPLLVVNLREALYRTRPLDEAAAHAAGLLAYCVRAAGNALPGQPDWGAVRAANGRQQPTPVTLVAVGNEAWFFWPPTPEDRVRLGLADDAAVVAWQVRCLVAYADALHAVAPNVQLIVDGLHDPWNPANRSANLLRRQVLQHTEVRKRYAYLTIHQYFPMGMWNRSLHGEPVAIEALDDTAVWYGLQGGPGLFDDHGRNTAFGDWYDDFIAAGWRVAATEWNWNGWDVEKQVGPRPFGQAQPMALGAASYLNGLIRQAAHTDIACQSMLLGESWDITAIRVRAGSAPWLFPQGHVLALYQATPGDRVLALEVAAIPGVAQPLQFASWYPAANRLAVVDAVALADEHSASFCLVHRQRTAPLRLRLRIAPGAALASGQARVRILSVAPNGKPADGPVTTLAEHRQAYQDGIIDLELPPATVVIVTCARLPTELD